MLVLWYLELAGHQLGLLINKTWSCLPLVEPHGILDEQQSLLRQKRRAQCGGKVEVVQEHSDHLRVVCNVHRFSILRAVDPWQHSPSRPPSLAQAASAHVVSARQAAMFI